MILRLYRAHAATVEADAIVAYVRDRIYPFNRRLDGLRSFQAGLRRVDEATIELALLSTWVDVDALMGGLGADLLRPAWLSGVQDRLTPIAADHFELVGEQVVGTMPLAGAVMRYVQGTLAARTGEAFFDFARERQLEQLGGSEIVASYIGRRLDEARGEAIYVAIWRDADAPAAAGGSGTTPARRAEWADYLEDWTFAAYEALIQVQGRPEAPPLLLADDRGEVVYATPAAAARLGRPISRLMGSDMGPLLDRLAADSVAHVVRGDAPWPGYRVLVIDADDADDGVVDALGAAGLIALAG